MLLTDGLNRPLRDLRVSVTDRCNFRCTYCMPKEVFGADFAFLPHEALLTFEEITRLVRILAPRGLEKVRLTGGEPLLRRDLERLIEQISQVDGIRDIAMTTNGSLLTLQKALTLKQAGLKRVSISLDSLEDETFMKLNDVHFPVSKVLAAIDAAHEAGLEPVKVNMVVKRGLNEKDIIPMAGHFRNTGTILRFIEFMDVGNSNGWRLDDVVPAAGILQQLSERWPLEAIAPRHEGEVARRYRYLDGSGEIGVIASVTQPFCGGCSRWRLSAQGMLYNCLFASAGTDVRELLRSERKDEEIASTLSQVWSRRTDRYSELRTEQTPNRHKVEMFHMGG